MNGKTIRDALQREGRTMVDLAAFLGTTPQNINNILTKDKFRLVARAFFRQELALVNCCASVAYKL